MTIGQTYYVRIHTDNNLVYTDFEICIGTPPNPPANDDCENVIELTVNSDLACTNTTTGTTAGASQSLPACDGVADDDVWYKFVATSTRHRVKVSGITESSTIVEVFSGQCTSPTSLNCAIIYYYRNEGTYQFNDLTIGQTYYVRIHTDNNLVLY